MKVVFDANVLVSGLARRSSNPPSILMDMWKRGDLDVFMSRHILTEAEDAWRKPYFQEFLTTLDIADILNEAISLSNNVKPAAGIQGVAEDEEDDLVLATAVAAEAEFLVTGDKYLLRIGEFRSIRIVSPREFLDLLLDNP